MVEIGGNLLRFPEGKRRQHEKSFPPAGRFRQPYNLYSVGIQFSGLRDDQADLITFPSESLALLVEYPHIVGQVNGSYVAYQVAAHEYLFSETEYLLSIHT